MTSGSKIYLGILGGSSLVYILIMILVGHLVGFDNTNMHLAYNMVILSFVIHIGLQYLICKQDKFNIYAKTFFRLPLFVYTIIDLCLIFSLSLIWFILLLSGLNLNIILIFILNLVLIILYLIIILTSHGTKQEYFDDDDDE